MSSAARILSGLRATPPSDDTDDGGVAISPRELPVVLCCEEEDADEWANLIVFSETSGEGRSGTVEKRVLGGSSSEITRTVCGQRGVE